MWNDRYKAPGYLFGTDPAAFLRREAGRLVAGQTALCVADGDGRNSVFLAEQGLQVMAMDASDVAVGKAQELADTRAVTVNFHVAILPPGTGMPDSTMSWSASFSNSLAPPCETRSLPG